MGFKKDEVVVRYDRVRDLVIVDYRHLTEVSDKTFARAYELRAALGVVDQKVLVLTNPDIFSRLKKLAHPAHNRAFSIVRAMAFVSASPIDNLFFQEYAQNIGMTDSVKSFRDEITAIAWLQKTNGIR